MNLLLDAHAFIWLDATPSKLSRAATQACSDPENSLWLSVVSLWEIQLKMQLGKLALRGLLETIIADQTKANGLQLLSLQPAHVHSLAKLPFHHNDPFDRILIAQATHENWAIVSGDSEFPKYSATLVW